MQSNERIREVWESTQENLETAVGTAYSSWNSIYLRHLEPCFRSVSSCLAETCCMIDTRRNRSNNRRDSFDIFFDMYDDDEAFGRDELERLLTSDEGYNEEPDMDETNGSRRRPSYQQRIMEYIVPESSRKDAMSTTSKGRKGNSLWSLIFPSMYKYQPSTNDLRDTSTSISNNRPRSTTKSSTQSSGTYRSRRDLFSDDDDPDEDAQIVSDNFAAGLMFKRQNSSSSEVSDGGLRDVNERLKGEEQEEQEPEEEREDLVLEGEREEFAVERVREDDEVDKEEEEEEEEEGRNFRSFSSTRTGKKEEEEFQSES